MRNAILLPAAAAVFACAPGPNVGPVPPGTGAAGTAAGRGGPAIIVSIDALSELTVRERLDRAAVPTLWAMFDSAACAASARPAMPSITAAGHAAIWTGAWGDVSGIAANSQPRLPIDRHDLLDLESGFSAEASRAEPIWVSAGAAGLRVAGHHVTQAPEPPGYRPLRTGEDEPQFPALRARAAAALGSDALAILNGYNISVAPHTALSTRSHALRPARGWSNIDWIPAGSPPPLEAAFRIGRDSVFALFYGTTSRGSASYTTALVSVGTRAGVAPGPGGSGATRRRAVHVTAAPTDTAWPTRAALARHFSEPVIVHDSAGNPFPVPFRLFELERDGSDYLLYFPSVQAVAANRAGLGTEYLLAIGGWVEGSPTSLYFDGAFGRRYDQGGDGTAEARWLEVAQLMTRQSIAGSEWLWRRQSYDLHTDYFSLGDNTDHRFYGWTERTSPAWNDGYSPRFQEVRRRAWALVDMKVAALAALARERGGTLFVTGDHGMRAVWRTFRPNAALRDAGLLTADTAGRIDIASSRAVSPNGYWVSVNRVGRRGGIVAESDVGAALAAVERALLDARGPDGQPIITRIFRASEHDSLGLGGPVGGDIYYETAPGYQWSSSARGSAASTSSPFAGHGPPSVAPDMQTVFCAIGPAFPAHRAPPVRLIDIAPTVSEWLGVPPPSTARGRSVLRELMR